MSHKDDERVLHDRLTRWITQHGGRVHPHLTLHTPSKAPRERVTDEKETTSSDTNDHNNNVVIRDRSRSHDGIATDDNLNNENYFHRGIFANHGAISKGEELIRLPSSLALDGRRFPSVYSCNESFTDSGNAANTEETADGKRNASPWLRCLASIIYAWNEKQRPQQKQQQQSLCYTSNNSNHGEEQVRDREHWTNNFYEPYLSTLPISYDSLLNWKAIELQHFLRGTTLRVVALQDADDSTATTMDISSLDDKLENSLKKRYETTVVPYLKYLNSNGFVFSSKNEKVHNVNIKKRKIDDSSTERLAVSQNPSRQFNEPKFDDGDAEPSIYDELYPLFRQGCMCISTRAFHMQSPESNNDLVQSFEIANPGYDAGGAKASATATNASPPSMYQGPYLLPYIDLLNHAPRHSAKHVTTLTRDPKNGSFVMVAERDIGLSEEICHAYDASGNVADDEMMDGGESTKDRAETGRLEASTSLTSAQLLQTFGFVDVKEVVAKLSRLADRQGGSGATPISSLKQTNFGNALTPAILTKKDICRICRQVAESSYPSSVQSFMLKSGLVDEGWEYWDMPTRNKAGDTDKSCDHDEGTGNGREKVLDCLPDEITIPFDNPLSDILITILCLNFLPDDALGELIESSDDGGLVLGQEVLDDYFLGKLVLHSLLEVVSEKLETYKVSLDEFQADCKRCPNSAEKYSSLLVLLRKLHSSNGSCVEKSTSELYWGENVSNDIDLLSTILTLDEITLKQLEVSKSVTQKFSYGLSVSLEERASLLELKRMVTMKLMQLDDFGNDDGN